MMFGLFDPSRLHHVTASDLTVLADQCSKLKRFLATGTSANSSTHTLVTLHSWLEAETTVSYWPRDSEPYTVVCDLTNLRDRDMLAKHLVACYGGNHKDDEGRALLALNHASRIWSK
jgi:hypothetical protein